MRATIEARFDSANSRYGLLPGWARANQTCTIGLVVESITKGSPITAASSARMPVIGLPSPAGFHASEAMTGRVAQLAASRSACSQACCRPARRRVIRSG